MSEGAEIDFFVELLTPWRLETMCSGTDALINQCASSSLPHEFGTVDAEGKREGGEGDGLGQVDGLASSPNRHDIVHDRAVSHRPPLPPPLTIPQTSQV